MICTVVMICLQWLSFVGDLQFPEDDSLKTFFWGEFERYGLDCYSESEDAICDY